MREDLDNFSNNVRRVCFRYSTQRFLSSMIFYIPNILLWIGFKKDALNIKVRRNSKILHLKNFREGGRFPNKKFLKIQFVTQEEEKLE